jgi:hypothetical protein
MPVLSIHKDGVAGNAMQPPTGKKHEHREPKLYNVWYTMKRKV